MRKILILVSIVATTFLLSLSALATPQKVFDYWPLKPGDYALPASVNFASSGLANPEKVLAEDGQSTHLSTGSDLVIDFGAPVGGFFDLKVAVSGTARVRLSYSEAAIFSQGKPSGAMEAISFTEKLTVRTYQVSQSGWFTDPVLMGSARYVRIQVQSGELDLDAIRCKITFLPCDPAIHGWFLSSDDLLNKVWYASYYTTCMDTIHSNQGAKSGREKIGEDDWVIVDGAKRDRLIWSGDLGITDHVVYVTNARYDIVRNSLLSLAHWQFPSGIYAACSLAELGKNVAGRFVEYSLWQVINSYDYYLYSGDASFLKEIYPGLLKAMDYHQAQTDKNGMILQRLPAQGFNYSYGLLRSGPVAYTNALYYLCLKDAAKIAQTQGDISHAGIFASRAEKVKANFDRYFWDDKTGAYLDVSSNHERHALDGNAVAITSGLADAQKSQKILAFIDRDLRLPWGDRQFDRPFGHLHKIPFTVGHDAPYVMPYINTFDALARFANGRDPEAVELVKRCWGRMAQVDPNFTTWEWIGKQGNPDAPSTSLVHAWSAGASFVLSENVLGVRPMEAGFASYEIAPRPSGLKWAQGAIPSPRGDIGVSWQDSTNKFEMEINAPAGKGPVVKLPAKGENFKVTINGETIYANGKKAANAKIAAVSLESNYFVIEFKEGGSYKIVLE